MLAARTGRPEAVQLLIARGANVNASETWQGETALMWAAAENHPEVVALLAKNGADLNAKSKVPEFPKVKVDAATMVVTALPKGGFTAFCWRRGKGAPDGVRALAEAGADLNATDPDGTTALNMAIINAHYEVAALLVEKGASLDVGDAAGMTPLYAAIDMRHQEPLINRPLAKPSGPMTPLDMVKVLLAHGADPNARLKTPLLMRQHNGGDASLNEGATPLMRAAKVSDVTTMAPAAREGSGSEPAAAQPEHGADGYGISAGKERRSRGEHDCGDEASHRQRRRPEPRERQRRNGAAHRRFARRRAGPFPGRNGTRLDIKDKFGRTPLDVAMGVPGGGGGRGRGGRAGGPPTAGPVRESTAALLKELMSARGL